MEHLAHFTVDVLRLTLWLVILAVVFVPLERSFALRPQKLLRTGVAADLGFYFASSLLPAVLIAPPMALFAVAIQRVEPPALIGWASGLPAWSHFALALLVSEVGSYWGHRWSHQIPLLWRFHSLHHSPEQMDWLVNSRGHPVDMVFVRLCGMMPLCVLGLSQPSSGARFAIAAAFVTTFWGFFIHANVRWRLGWFEQVVATPAFHHWHHTRSGPVNRNYATLLPGLDRLFGTLHLPRDWPAAYGIDDAYLDPRNTRTRSSSSASAPRNAASRGARPLV
jgi:sterol desaturase/sphingolipid hydroxylase (fatty acid hydroxylase superfamily)